MTPSHEPCRNAPLVAHETRLFLLGGEGRVQPLAHERYVAFVRHQGRDTVSPWHAAYKIHLLVPAEVTFCLGSGGHNVGVANPPGPGVRRSYQIGTRKAGAGAVAAPAFR